MRENIANALKEALKGERSGRIIDHAIDRGSVKRP
jgi:hypothetical protein